MIIPTFNEGGNIEEAIDKLKDTGVEIVVVDGGSTDGTVSVCEKAGIKVLRSDPGRAVQMNTGAMEASGNVLLFLHADTRLPDGFEEEVKQAMAQGSVGGAFLFGTDIDGPSMRLIENMAHFRTYRMGIVYGDQAIFSGREAFFRAGTFPDQPFMEDYELWKRLKKLGRRSIIPLSVITSARKWKKYGTWRVTLLHQAVMWLYLLGVRPQRLAKWYGGRLEKMENGK